MNKTIKWMWICIIAMWVFMLAELIVKEFSQIASIILLCCECACIVAIIVLSIIEFISQYRKDKRMIRELDEHIKELHITMEKIEKEPFKVVDINEDKKE